jgi:hypothetical protein
MTIVHLWMFVELCQFFFCTAPKTPFHNPPKIKGRSIAADGKGYAVFRNRDAQFYIENPPSSAR